MPFGRVPRRRIFAAVWDLRQHSPPNESPTMETTHNTHTRPNLAAELATLRGTSPSLYGLLETVSADLSATAFDPDDDFYPDYAEFVGLFGHEMMYI